MLLTFKMRNNKIIYINFVIWVGVNFMWCVYNRYDLKKKVMIYFGLLGGALLSSDCVWAQSNPTVDSASSALMRAGFISNKTKNTQIRKLRGYSHGGYATFNLPLSESVSMGLGYTYLKTDVKSDNFKTNLYNDYYFISGKYQPAKWYVFALAGYNHGTYKRKEQPVLTQHHTDMYNVKLFSGYNLGNVNNYSGIKYTYVHPESNNQAGMPYKDGEVITAVIGTSFAKKYNTQAKILFVPKINLNLSYDLKSNNNQTLVEIPDANVAYVLNGRRLHRFALNSSIGIGIQFKELEIEAKYGIDWRTDYLAQTGIAALKYHF